MSGFSLFGGRTLCTAFRAALLCFAISVLLTPVQSLATEDQQPKKTMPIQATVSVDWDIDNGGTRNQGSMTLRMQGTAHLAEGVSVMDEAAPPGFFITYAAKGVEVSYTYSETITQEHPPRGCPALMAEYQGSGGFTLEEVNSAMTSGLNIRKMGSLLPKEALAFVPAEAKEMMIDYYDFFALAMKQKVQGRKRGSNDCNFQPATKEFNPGALTIRFRITDEGKMEGSREWSVSKNSGRPTFGLRLSDLPSKMERRPLVPEPDGGGDVTYTVDWAFGEVDPHVQIQRKEGEYWVPLLGDKPVEVTAGEKMELRGVVLPEEQDPGTGEWVISGEGGSGGKMYIKKYQASHEKGEVKYLDPKNDLNTPEVLFYWVDEGTGTVEYKTTADGKPLQESVEFEVKKPKFAFLMNAAPSNRFGLIEMGEGSGGKECCKPTLTDDQQRAEDEFNAKCEQLERDLAELIERNGTWEIRNTKPKIIQQMIDLGCTPRGVQYEGITFTATPQEGPPGKVRFVQLLSRTIMEEFEGEQSSSSLSNVLDGCYPYPKNISEYATFDAPGFNDLGGNSYKGRLYEFEMYLLYMPNGDGNEWIPLKKAPWRWGAGIRCVDGKCDEDSAASVIPMSGEADDCSEYPEWDECSASY